jgi:hypothetical protein
MEVIVMKVKRKKGGAMVTGVIRACIGPCTGDGLDEALGLAIGLGAIRSGEAMFDAELLAGLGEKFGAIGGAAVGEEALDLDAMSFVEVDGLLEGRQDAGSLFVWEERGKSEAGVIVDGDVEALDAGAWIALGGSPVHRPPLSPPPPRRSPVARTPGRAKRPSFLLSRWRSSPGEARS